MADRTHRRRARTSAERAYELACPLGDSYQNALATLNLGGLLVVIDREADGLPHLDEALGYLEQAESFGRDRDFRVTATCSRPAGPGSR